MLAENCFQCHGAEQAEGRPAPRFPGRPAQGGRRRAGRRPRRARQEPLLSRPSATKATRRCRRRPGCRPRPSRPSPPGSRWAPLAGRPPAPRGHPRWPRCAASTGRFSRSASRRRPPVKHVATGPRRRIDCLRPGQAGEKGLDAGAAGRPPHADPPGVVRPDRPAADAGGGGRLRQRPGAGRLREGGRSAAGVAALRRALGPALARRGPLRRHQGLRLHGGTPLSLSPTPTAITSSAPSTTTCPTTSSSCSNWPPTGCRSARTSGRWRRWAS